MMIQPLLFRLFTTAVACAALPAQAQDNGISTTAQCAAFWSGWVAEAERSPFLPTNPADARLAAAFRDAARSEGVPGIDRFLEGQTPAMARMIRAAIAGDKTSRGLMERLARGCEDAARRHGLI